MGTLSEMLAARATLDISSLQFAKAIAGITNRETSAKGWKPFRHGTLFA